MTLESQSITRAAAEGDAETIRALLANGTSVDTVSSGGQTPLMLASIFGHEEVVALLLLAGADSTLSDPRDLTAKEWAVRRGFHDIAQLIEDHSGHRSPLQSRKPTARSSPAAREDSPEKVSEPTPASEQTPTPKMGGAAAAILRNRLGRSIENNAIPESNRIGVEAYQTPATVETSIEEQSPDMPVNAQAGQVSESSSTDQISGDESRVLPFVPKHIEDQHFSDAPLTSDWDPHIPPPDVVLAKHDRAAETTLSKQENADALVAAPEERKAERVLPSQQEPPRPLARPQRNLPPSFLGSSSTPASSARPLIWVLVAVTLGASAYAAYRLNSYLSRQETAPAVASQQVQPQPQNAAPASSSPQVSSAEASTSDHTAPVTGGPLAGTEQNLLAPEYPSSARRKGIEEVITITVRVNRAGKVISWRTGTGDASLRAAALKAARRSTFTPAKLPGTGEVVGTITYNFKLPKDVSATQ